MGFIVVDRIVDSMSQQEVDRDSHGRFRSKHSKDDVIAAVREHAPAATSDVADELGIARQSADYRLRKLADSGRVRQKKIAASLVWSVDEEDES